MPGPQKASKRLKSAFEVTCNVSGKIRDKCIVGRCLNFCHCSSNCQW